MVTLGTVFPSLPCLPQGDAGHRASSTSELLEGAKGNWCVISRQIVLDWAVGLGVPGPPPRPPPYKVDLKPDPLTILVSDMNLLKLPAGGLGRAGLGHRAGKRRRERRGRLYIPVKNLDSRIKQT